MNIHKKLRKITPRYVRHIINNPYRYSIVGSKVMIQHARFQPEVRQLYEGCFLVNTPHRSFKNAIDFILIYNRTDQDWWLVSNISYSEFGEESLQTCMDSFISKMAIRYQVGELRNGMFYIPIVNNSLQNAYYRLIDFILEYYGARNFAIQNITNK